MARDNLWVIHPLFSRDNIRHRLINGQDLRRSTASHNVQNKSRSSLKRVNLTNKRENKMLIDSRLPYQCQQNLGKFYGLNRKSNIGSFIYLTDAQLDCPKKC
jgi:hypothetical protein